MAKPEDDMTAIAATLPSQPEMPDLKTGMSRPLAMSFVFHFMLVVVAIVGLPYMKPKLPDIDTSITVEIMDISDVTQTDKHDIHRPIETKKPEQKKEEPPKQVMPQVTSLKPPKPVAPTPPQAEEFTTPDETEQKADKPQPEKAKTPPKPDKRPTLTKPADEEQQEEFKSLLRNLMPAEDPVQGEARPGEQTSPTSQLGQKMSISELDSLKRQMNQCWSVLAGARYAEDLVVELRIFTNPDRSVRDVVIVDQLKYNSDQFYRAAADGAKRAVFKCSPLDLPPDKYDLWKVITVTFDPRKML